MKHQGKAPKRVKFTVRWCEYNNDDLERGAAPDKGWYVEKEPEGIHVGRDFYGPGYATFDEALAVIDKWCEGRGFKRPQGETQIFTITVVSQRVEEL